MRRVMTIVTAAAACLGVAASVALAAGGVTRVSASLSGIGNPAKARLTIKHNGRTLYAEPVRSSVCHADCATAAIPPGRSPLRVLDLESNGQSDVVLGLFSGGAHCCFIDQVFSLDPGTQTYVQSQHDFYDPGARIVRLGGHYEFLSADEAFAYAFTDFADSGLPIQIWTFGDRRFRDVTRQFPVEIKADAAKWMRAFHHDLKNGVGLIAAWAADEDLLGNDALVSSTLATEKRKGDLRSSLGPAHSGAKFITALQKLLRKDGYTAP